MKRFKALFVLFLTALLIAGSFAPTFAAMSDDEALSVYADILQAFRDYEESGWKKYDSPLIQDSWFVKPQADPEMAMTLDDWDASLSGAGFDIKNSYVVYSLYDINSDGTPELMIGVGGTSTDENGSVEFNDNEVFGVYAIVDGKVKSVIQKDDARELVEIYTDGTIGDSWGMMGMSQEKRYALSPEGTLAVVYSIETSYSMNEEDEEVMTYVENSADDEADYETLTEGQAQEIFNQYSKDKVELDWRVVNESGEG